MMKKLLYIIGFLMFASIVFSPAITHKVLAVEGSAPAPADSSNSSGSCSFPWVNCLINSNIPDKDWSVSFGTDDEEKVGQDMYEVIYSKVNVSPKKQALKKVTGSYGVPETDMVKLIYGDYTPILKRSPQITQDKAIQKMLDIQRQYSEEKDIMAFQAEIEATVEPSEFFENGDVSDSGFDLVNDLGNIENILFKKNDPIDVGGTFTPNEDLSNPGKGSNLGTPVPAGLDKFGNNNSPNAQTGGTGSSVTSGQINPTGQTQTQNTPQSSSVQDNPNSCDTNTALNSALNKFESSTLTDSRFVQNTSTQESNSVGNISVTSNTDGNIGSGAAALEYNPPAIKAVDSADSGNWALNLLKDPPCNDVFCLSVRFIKKPATATYQETDNCIACHVQKIVEKLKYTTNHNLLPGKASGNLLEPGLCKNAISLQLGSVGLHFYTSFKPILTPTNDDLIYGTNIGQEWEKFLNTYKPFKSPTKPKDPNALLEAPPDVTDVATKAALAFAAPDATFDEINKAVQEQVNLINQNINKATAVAEVSPMTDSNSGFYQGIQRELDQMNFYFDQFRTVLQSINEQTDGVDGACLKLKDKKECT